MTDRLAQLFQTATAENVRTALAEARMLADEADPEQAGYVEGLTMLFRLTYPFDELPGVDDEAAAPEGEL